jgi:hypothetical protein
MTLCESGGGRSAKKCGDLSCFGGSDLVRGLLGHSKLLIAKALARQ